MNIVIIEDERYLADDLERNVRELIDEPLEIVILRSVKESITYFKSAASPDLIFSDIQLGDGLSFEIFISATVTSPIIFCTAYDVYALEAFKVNGIDYILKPFTKSMLERALDKYKQLKGVFSDKKTNQYAELLSLLSSGEPSRPTSILIYYQDRIMPVKLEEVALFRLENNLVHMETFSGKVYYPQKTLEELEKLTGIHFFRANRQYLISRKAIIDVSSFFSRKLSLNLVIQQPERVLVSKTKSTAFLEWLSKAP